MISTVDHGGENSIGYRVAGVSPQDNYIVSFLKGFKEA